MDWFSWLSRSSLDPSLVYQYGLTLTHNELEEEDISFFTHDFLLSMGISVAKHRLEITKLATKHTKTHSSTLFLALKSSFSTRLLSWTCRSEESSSALVVVPTTRTSRLKRSKKQLFITNGGDGFSSVHPTACRSQDDHDWCSAVEEIKWDTMFQDLKPT